MERIKKIYSYLDKFKHATIRIQSEEPNVSSLLCEVFDQEKSICRETKELLPDDAPQALRKRVTTTSYYDVNVHHNLITDRLVTRTLYFLNNIPINWHSQK